jgi:hypothetical protein
MNTTRYQIRDLGAGLLEPGGLSRDGAASFTAIIEELPTFAITAIATVPYPYAPISRLSGEARERFDRSPDGGEFFRSHAAGIDRGGGAVGWAVTAAPLGTTVMTEALHADAGQVLRRLPPLGGFTSSAARAVGLDGTLVGDSSSGETSVATAWRGTEAIRLDGGLPEATFSRAVAINARGTILGVFQTRSGAVRGWLRDANGGVEPDVGPTGIDAFPSDINDSGRVVGAAADQRAWFAQRSGSARRLPLLPGTAISAARGVNSAGAIVGDCDETACLWSPSAGGSRDAGESAAELRPVDLNELGSVPDQGRLHRAVRINDGGLILCAGSSHRGQQRVYLLSPYLTAGPRASEIPDGMLFGLQPRVGVFGVQLSAREHSDGMGRALLPLSKLCQLVSALDCPACLRLVVAPCGSDWGVSVEGVPRGIRVSLLGGEDLLGELAPGPPRGDGDPFTGKGGPIPALELVFSPRPSQEYFLALERVQQDSDPETVFPVRLTVFRPDDVDTP